MLFILQRIDFRCSEQKIEKETVPIPASKTQVTLPSYFRENFNSKQLELRIKRFLFKHNQIGLHAVRTYKLHTIFVHVNESKYLES